MSSSPPAETSQASGTAAVGAPLANATVSLLCANGGTPTTATTSSSGSYSMSLGSSCTAPYFLKVVGVDTSVTPNVTTTLYAFADAAGNINITPLTDIAARFATGNNPDLEFEAVKAASKKAGDLWSSTTAAQGKAKLVEILTDLGLSTSGINDFLHGTFSAVKGDKLDDLLEALKAKRGGLSLADLADRALKLGGSPGDQPWNALFRVGQNEIKLSLSGCQLYTHNSTANPSQTTTPVASAVLTLTRSEAGLSASITPNAADTTYTFAPAFIAQAPSASTNHASFALTAYAATPYLGVSGSQETPLEENNTYSNRSFDISVESRKTEAAAAESFVTRVYFANNYRNMSSVASARLACDTVANPLTRGSVGSLQPQSRLVSLARVAPAMTLASSQAENSTNGSCRYEVQPVVGIFSMDAGPSYVDYTYAVSPEGALSLDGVKVGDFLSTANTGAIYYERSQYYGNGSQPDRFVSIIFDWNRGFWVDRTATTSSQYCGID